MTHQHVAIMSEYDFSGGCLLQHMNHLIRFRPGRMISGQPALSAEIVIVLLHDILIRGKNPGAAVLQVDLEDTKTGCMTRAQMDDNSACQKDTVAMQRLPIEVELKIVRQIDTCRGSLAFLKP